MGRTGRALNSRPLLAGALVGLSAGLLLAGGLRAEEPASRPPISSPAGEEGRLPPEALETLRRAGGIESYRTRFSLETRQESGEEIRLSGVLVYQRPGLRRLELRDEESGELLQLIVTREGVEWQYAPKGGTVYRIPNPPEAPGPHRPFADVQPGSLRFLGRADSEGGTLLRFEAVPADDILRTSPVPLETMEIEVAEADGMVRRTRLIAAGGEPVLIQRYTQVETGVPVEAGTFQFVPPKDAAVVDLEAP